MALEQGISKPDYAIGAGFSYGSSTPTMAACISRSRSTAARRMPRMPFTGIDALEAANHLLDALYAWRKTWRERVSAIAGIGSPQLTVGLIKGGINTNVVPDRSPSGSTGG